MKLRKFGWLVGLALPGMVWGEVSNYDVVVYGGTSGGVAAAVHLKRKGRSVVLVSPTEHLGGLTTSGLGWTDLGDRTILGGIGREFYQRVYQHYQKPESWNWQTRQSFGNVGQGGPAFSNEEGTGSVFEPKVAEGIFRAWVEECGLEVRVGRLDLDDGVVKVGSKVEKIRLEDGREFAGKVFIDASYEGDLLPGAGVTFRVGREANAEYGETYSGIQVARATKNQLPNGIDPYVEPGNPASGLLPGVEADAGGQDGEGDGRMQAYCYRMVLTDVEANRVAVAKPEGYRESDYELLFRAIEAGQTGNFFKLDLMPNRKTDSNNTGGISTDFIGKNYGPGWDWTTLNHDERLALAKAHENWQRGLIWTLQNHPRVPLSIRNAYAKWGLPADEFTDHGNWPWQLYVREARRMVSDYVMTQGHCGGVLVAADSVGLAAYAMDSHHVQRHVRDGMVKNEGDVQMPVSKPYPISYRAIVPRKSECTNLLVPWSLSATHMAFGSIRMEPVFMILSQSAAVAADLSIQRNEAVQDVPYAVLRPALLEVGQALGSAPAGLPGVIYDQTDTAAVTVTGAWTSAASAPGFVGADYLHDGNEGRGEKSVFYAFPEEVKGKYRVWVRWTSHTNRASNARYEVVHGGGTKVIALDQRQGGGEWQRLGYYDFGGVEGQGVRISNAGADGYVIADAVGLSPVMEGDDSDDDGVSDVRELEMGLDPDVSQREFYVALRQHPEFLGLYSGEELAELGVEERGWMEESGGIRYRFALGEGEDAEEVEELLEKDGSRKFMRVVWRSEPVSWLEDLAEGRTVKIVCYGTSLTANGAWVGKMRDWLAAKYPGRVTVINGGMSGKNSATGLAELESRVIAQGPDVVFLEFGVNDAFQYTDGTPVLSVEQAKANLVEMIQRVRAANPEVGVVLQTMNSAWDSPVGSNASATLRPQLAAYYQMYREVAEEMKCFLVDHHSHWRELQERDPAAFRAAIPDGVHPTAQGLEMMMIPLLKWKIAGGRPLP